MLEKHHKIAVLGASDNPERYSYKAVKMLKEYGYTPIPVRPGLDFILDEPVVPHLSDITESIHTLSIYIGPGKITPLIKGIIQLAPKRVIMNPGAESEELKKALDEAGIFHEDACTLVLLRTEQF